MSHHIRTQAQPASSLAVRSAPSRFLQRTCACGSTLGPTGECTACRRQRLAQQRGISRRSKFTSTAFNEEEVRQTLDLDRRSRVRSLSGFDFGRMNVHTAQRTTQAPLWNARCPMDGSCPDDPLVDYQGSGRTWCDTDTGNMMMTVTEHCAGDCVAQHEAVHKADRAGCCRGVKRCLDDAGSSEERRKACLDSFEEWYPKLSDWTECNAYTREVTCLTSLISGSCEAGGAIGAECCDRLRRELAFATRQRDSHCASATFEPCPFPGLGDFPLPRPGAPRLA
jgi:hypothetical protein